MYNWHIKSVPVPLYMHYVLHGQKWLPDILYASGEANYAPFWTTGPLLWEQFSVDQGSLMLWWNLELFRACSIELWPFHTLYGIWDHKYSVTTKAEGGQVLLSITTKPGSSAPANNANTRFHDSCILPNLYSVYSIQYKANWLSRQASRRSHCGCCTMTGSSICNG